MPSHSVLVRTVLPAVLLLGVTILGCEQEELRPPRDEAADETITKLQLGDSSVLLPGSTPNMQADVPLIKTPNSIVDTMLMMANVTKDDVVYDLGSGDGRIPIRAARKYGARGIGVEINTSLVEKSRAKAKEAGVDDRVKIIEADLFKVDISEATVVTLYLHRTLNLKLRPKLFRELEPGTRVVSHDFDMGEWEPDSTVKSGDDVVYRWTIPEETPAFVGEE